MKQQGKFLQNAENKVFDLEHRKRINFNMAKYHNTVKAGKEQYENLELARTRASLIKKKVIEHLDQYLIEFESNFIKKGGKVIWAENKAEAQKEILAILQKHKVRTVVKSKSMITEEIQLNEFLEQHNINPVETDLGEYIVQLAGEAPYHIVTPAMHKSKEDVAKLFAEKLQTSPELTPRELTLVAREKLREKYIHADAGITGANFLLADIGAVSITENEGNARLCTAAPNVHIVIAGIEKLLPSVHDLNLFLPLLSTYGTGQKVTNYNSILTSPRRKDEIDGPEYMYIILLDNNRSNLLSYPQQRQALGCIRCGACLNACPVYKNAGGHSYERAYPGPIGSVIMPFLGDFKENIHLSHASSLCGNCTDVCPVKINLHHLLLLNRQLYEKKFGGGTKWEKVSWYFWKKGMLNRNHMNRGSVSLKNKIFKFIFSSTWGKRRAMPQFPEKSFNQLWQEQYGNNTNKTKKG